MAYPRSAAYPTTQVDLQIRFRITTSTGLVFIDPVTVDVDITDPDETVVETGLAPTKLRTGVYQLLYTVPDDGVTGTWIDTWNVDFGDGEVQYNLNFEVSAFAAAHSLTPLNQNCKYTVILDESIENSTGDELGSDYSFYFYTTFNPFYASLEDLKPILGHLFASLPSDDVLAYQIYRASVLAEGLMAGVDPETAKALALLELGTRQYVLYCAALAIIFPATNALAGSIRKRLGDADFSRSGAVTIVKDFIAKIEKTIKRWELVVRSRGKYFDTIPPLAASLFSESTEMNIPGRLPYPGDTGIPMNYEYLDTSINRYRTKSTWPTEITT